MSAVREGNMNFSMKCKVTVAKFIYRESEMKDGCMKDETWQLGKIVLEPPDDDEWHYEIFSTHREPIMGGFSLICVWKPRIRKGPI